MQKGCKSPRPPRDPALFVPSFILGPVVLWLDIVLWDGRWVGKCVSNYRFDLHSDSF